MPNTLWQDLLPEMPDVTYFGNLANQSFTPQQRQHFGGQQGNIYNRYLGGLGQQVMGGGNPTQTFENFLGGFPWLKEFNMLPRWKRGVNPSGFAPSLKWTMY